MRLIKTIISVGVLSLASLAQAGDVPATKPAGDSPLQIVSQEMLYEKAPFPSCHASTIVQTRDGNLAAAFFGGTRERNPDVCIWLCRQIDGKWTVPAQVADGVQPNDAQGKPERYPCWNPVLFQPKSGPLLLYYKVGPTPQSWWGMLITSEDDGVSWSKPQRLPDNILGPIKDKPIQLDDGRILSPSSTESDGRHAHVEISTDHAKTWRIVGPIDDPKEVGAIQPTILRYASGDLQMLTRTKVGTIAESWSTDRGEHWSGWSPTPLPNPDSGIDAVTLADGLQVLVYNPALRDAPAKGRSPLAIAISHDGKQWKDVLTLEETPEEYSYPAVIQTRDGLIHVTYSYQRKTIKHVVVKEITPSATQGN